MEITQQQALDNRICLACGHDGLLAAVDRQHMERREDALYVTMRAIAQGDVQDVATYRRWALDVLAVLDRSKAFYEGASAWRRGLGPFENLAKV